MQQKIQTITLPLPFRMGSVNCYLIKTDNGYILIDTGGSNGRGALESALQSASCKPGNLQLIVLTHGDFDHIGNASYLREKFGATIAMHRDDCGMAEHGDMFWNRKSGNAIIRILAPVLFRFGQANRFQPDVCLADGDTLAEYGFDATVLEIPGHSKGSIGILMADGDLFCGDLLDSTKGPALNTIMDDVTTARASVEKLKGLAVNTVYPGHGKPFQLDQLKMKGN